MKLAERNTEKTIVNIEFIWGKIWSTVYIIYDITEKEQSSYGLDFVTGCLFIQIRSKMIWLSLCLLVFGSTTPSF